MVPSSLKFYQNDNATFKKIISLKETHIMKQLVLFLLLMQAGHASTYTLSKVLKSAGQNSVLSKALQQESLALEAKNKASTASDPLELFGEGTKAYPNGGGSGNEYAVGVSKKFIFGNIQEQEQKATRLSNQAYLLDEERNILNFKNGLKNIYHQHCLDGQNYRSFKQSYQEFVKLYNKKQKAYKYQEISKTELMQKDMYPIRTHVKLGNTFQLSKEAYDKRIQSTHEVLDRYSNSIDSISLSAQYTEELDVDKYTVGLSIPLNFTSARSEQERAAAMYQNSAISLKHEQTMTEKKSLLSQLRSQLRSNALMVKTLKRNYQKYQKDLLPLIKKSYDLGETSVIEYLLNRQRSYQLRQEIYTTKKTYYHTLFKLYTISEKKD
jgi:hypothetical protein